MKTLKKLSQLPEISTSDIRSQRGMDTLSLYLKIGSKTVSSFKTESEVDELSKVAALPTLLLGVITDYLSQSDLNDSDSQSLWMDDKFFLFLEDEGVKFIDTGGDDELQQIIHESMGKLPRTYLEVADMLLHKLTYRRAAW